MIAYLLVFLCAAATTFAVTPMIRRLVVRAGGIVQPGGRRVHTIPTPTMGGLAMYVGFLAALGVSRLLPFFSRMNEGSPEPLAAFLTCTLIVGLGAVDDKRGASAPAKLTAQIFIGGVLVLAGAQLVYFWLPVFGIVNVGRDLGAVLTISWVVLVANAVNLIDGLDGLAAGMVAIAAGTFFVYMSRSPSEFGSASPASLLSVIAAGICVGFLPWNFHPARIFMGDSGSMLLGMLLSIATISGFGRNPYPPSGGDLAVIAIPIIVPLLVLAVPFLDVALAIARRVRKGTGISHADKEHIHHRLMDIGHTHRVAVLLMYLWSALLAGSALAVGLIDGRLAVGAILVVAGVLFLITALPRLVRRTDAGASPLGGAASPAGGSPFAPRSGGTSGPRTSGPPAQAPGHTR